jgi:hypothetical protein
LNSTFDASTSGVQIFVPFPSSSDTRRAVTEKFEFTSLSIFFT